MSFNIPSLLLTLVILGSSFDIPKFTEGLKAWISVSRTK
jgi:hypothetical protein